MELPDLLKPKAQGYAPADRRIQNFLNDILSKVEPLGPVELPKDTLILDRPGMARELSLPEDSDSFSSDMIQSYRVKQGILHNPRNDRRTTKGVFHIADAGLPIPDDKVAVPASVFKKLLLAAFKPTDDLLTLPFTSRREKPARLFASLLLRPIVCPEVSGVSPQKTMEIRFFAPSSLISNLDFVESIFGNGGDPYLTANDAGLDPDHWIGHSGCVILAPHLTRLKKKDLGLPSWDQATERQKRDGMCWKSADEEYNGGEAFKITCRDERGVIVTVIADNYFGYCKKEVKTQISFSANLFGACEEEHSGGAIAFPSNDLGQEFRLSRRLSKSNEIFEQAAEVFKDVMERKPEGYAVDRTHPDILYVPEDAEFNLPAGTVRWTQNGIERKIKLLARCTYLYPSGYKVRVKKQTGSSSWHLYGTRAEGTLCHKPSTVSGGGKSEISKSIVNAMIQGPVVTADFSADLMLADAILKRPMGDQFLENANPESARRPILGPERSLGSVIKLLTPSEEYTPKYNAWLQSIPPYIKEIVYLVKRYHKPEWGDNWQSHFSVDRINGHLGHEIKFEGRKLTANYLRVGLDRDGSWRVFRLRHDFSAAEKLQVEDDITASTVVASKSLEGLNPEYSNPSVKIVSNCEFRLFQRPDDAIHRGYDKQAEADIAAGGSFLSNFEPLTQNDARELIEDALGFDLYTDPMQELLMNFVQDGKPDYVVSSAHPRMVDGAPSKNPRYLQNRPDLVNPKQKYLAEIGARLARKLPTRLPVHMPVNAVLSGRRGNPPEPKAGLPMLAVYNPIHYQELPELFMDFITSMTGKSPSTTGFGSEGALTKGPFNALLPIHDLNSALVSMILTRYDGFSTAAGHIGPNIRVDHDISLLVPELWCRMTVEERKPEFLIRHGYLEKINDYHHKGRAIPASLLGYRITARFVKVFLGRLFNSPGEVFSDEMLKPELQNPDLFAEGIESIGVTQKTAAEHYFADGSIEAACPPLRAILHIMARGHYENKKLDDPAVRSLFSYEALEKSDWYRARLSSKQKKDIAQWEKHLAYLTKIQSELKNNPAGLDLAPKIESAQKRLNEVKSPAYLSSLNGTLGADPFIPSL